MSHWESEKICNLNSNDFLKKSHKKRKKSCTYVVDNAARMRHILGTMLLKRDIGWGLCR